MLRPLVCFLNLSALIAKTGLEEDFTEIVAQSSEIADRCGALVAVLRRRDKPFGQHGDGERMLPTPNGIKPVAAAAGGHRFDDSHGGRYVSHRGKSDLFDRVKYVRHGTAAGRIRRAVADAEHLGRQNRIVTDAFTQLGGIAAGGRRQLNHLGDDP